MIGEGGVFARGDLYRGFVHAASFSTLSTAVSVVGFSCSALLRFQRTECVIP